MSSAIALENVEVKLGGVVVLHDVSLQLAPGEVLALVGPSGSGKTTLLRTLTGFVAPTRGAVHLGGRLASADGRILIPPETRNLVMVFQDLALWPHLTVHGNLAFGLAARGLGRQEREVRITAILERVGLGGAAKRYPGELSGGERQRVAIARALVLEPHAVLLDEPLGNVDVALKRELLALFRELLQERGVTAIYVTHEAREAAALGDRIAVLEQGRIVQVGTIEGLSAQPATSFVRVVVGELAYGVPSARRSI
jgi:ABC-type Fe3+/spermidine/putrescine transport system ATPase subunit